MAVISRRVIVNDSSRPTLIAVGACDVALLIGGLNSYNAVFIGGADVTQDNGFPLTSDKTYSFTLNSGEELFGHAAAGQGAVEVFVLTAKA